MNKLIISIIATLIIVVASGTLFVFQKPIFPDTKPIPPSPNTVTLKELAAARRVRIGGNYDYELRSETHDRIFEQEYNMMTAGMFWGDGSHPSRTEFDFSEMDYKVNWGLARNMELYGQTLVWFDETEMPDWLKAAPTAEVEAIMNEYIDTVVGRYAGKIKFWNVVNEAVDYDGTLRQNHKWAEAMGNDYIRKAFIRAHAADPTAVLYYNDFDIESNEAKFEGVKKLLINLKNQGVPVHALGWQMHVKPGSFDPTTLLARFNEIADMGLDNYITELDVELPANASEADYEQQKQIYKTIVQTFLAARRHKAIVIWGLRDGSPNWLTNGHPLLFDENFRKKPAYFGVQEALEIKKNNSIKAPPTTQPSVPSSSIRIYHGVSTHSWSNLVTPGGNQVKNITSEVDAYESATGRTVAWVAFAHEWQTDGRAFPSEVAISVRNRGATPLIFLNLRSFDIIDESHQVEPLYTLDAIISGQFDSDFAVWADGAKNFGSELIVDWGWEMNGDWAIWNGAHNGGDIEGPRKFREAYRHIIELMQNRGATNIRWAFHINFPTSPNESWNAFENYYPGNDVIDIVGASIYTAQAPTDNFFPSFESLMDPAYARLTHMAPGKPVYVFEFGAAAGNPLGSSVNWADKALANILSGRWPAVRSFAWWNDYWSQDDNPAHDTEMRVEAVPGLAAVFKSRLSGVDTVGDHAPIFK